MNTEAIIESCRESPGVTVRQTGSCTELLLSGSEGRGCMRLYPVFPGMTLAQISVRAPSWPAPVFPGAMPETCGPLIVNYCTHGRCELVLNDGRSTFLTPGHIALTEKFASGAYRYPGRVYDGVELFIDPEVAQGGLPVLREGFGLELPALRTRYCPGGGMFLARLPLPEALTARLLETPDEAHPARSTGLQTGVIDLLALLLHDAPAQAAEPGVYYTRLQVEMARQMEAAISENPAGTHTARGFAERFSISEGSVRHYFQGVYGMSIAQYAARCRMQAAAALLAGTRLSVTEIANRVGYLNQSKFSAAFRRAYACTPLEYRRASQLRSAQAVAEESTR